jgi:hypothetical protein
VKQVSISGGDGQTPRDHDSTTNLLNRLDFPTPTRSTVVKVAGNGVPGAVGQGRVALLPGLEVAWVNGTGQIRQGFGSGSQSELDATTTAGCLSAVAADFEHWIEPLWVSALVF